MPVCRNWQTTATQNRVEKSVWVRVPPPAPCEVTLLFEPFSRKAEFFPLISLAISKGFKTVQNTVATKKQKNQSKNFKRIWLFRHRVSQKPVSFLFRKVLQTAPVTYTLKSCEGGLHCKIGYMRPHSFGNPPRRNTPAGKPLPS